MDEGREAVETSEGRGEPKLGPVALARCGCFFVGRTMTAVAGCAEHADEAGRDSQDGRDGADGARGAPLPRGAGTGGTPENGTGRCSTCGIEEDLDLLDGMDDGTGDYTLLGCVRCAGPDWLPALSLDAHASVAPSLERAYAAHRAAVDMRGIVWW